MPTPFYDGSGKHLAADIIDAAYERPGDFGTSLVIHFGAGDNLYLDASTWHVYDLDGSNPDDDGNVHYLATAPDALVIDHNERTVRLAGNPVGPTGHP